MDLGAHPTHTVPRAISVHLRSTKASNEPPSFRKVHNMAAPPSPLKPKPRDKNHLRWLPREDQGCLARTRVASRGPGLLRGSLRRAVGGTQASRGGPGGATEAI
ncbi:hypothetical protein CYMTET_35445 [Cymbomonas tetramitiformis]|uniref:Uncharacterized protein n=1 Tax=Cymbomonas tetramitiformis TaxID=36881 RepID=A0AAE0F958_9CHLO|nr:hypothetical protein CYMTET_35445 [Cymbomonas tetramitiformis]